MTVVRLAFVATVAIILGTASACAPSYPECATDDHCAEKSEVCVEGFCKQCRDDSQCNPGGTRKCMQCGNDRTCQKKFKCCTSDLDCPGEKCWPHLTDPNQPGECGDPCLRVNCPDGKKCENGQCVQVGCSGNEDCPPGQKCIGGQCIEQECEIATIYFDFNESRVRMDQEATIQANAECIKKIGQPVTLEGHCDERGDAEYNLALGQRRANAVQRQYKARGVADNLMKTISYGKERPVCTESEPSCWDKNRRVETAK